MLNRAVSKLNQAIKLWARNKAKLVVAIDGYTGVGKTALLKKLAASNKNILPVNRDAFVFSRKTVARLLEKTRDRSKIFELKICDNQKLTKLITAFRKGRKSFETKVYNPVSGKIDIKKKFDLSKNILIVEGVFLFHPELLNHVWDKRIYLVGDKKTIKARRISREKQKWGSKYFSETHPDSYFKQVMIAFERYEKQYQPRKAADLVVEIP